MEMIVFTGLVEIDIKDGQMTSANNCQPIVMQCDIFNRYFVNRMHPDEHVLPGLKFSMSRAPHVYHDQHT